MKINRIRKTVATLKKNLKNKKYRVLTIECLNDDVTVIFHIPSTGKRLVRRAKLAAILA